MKKYKLWALILRALILIIPAFICLALSFLSDRGDTFIDWLDRKLPDPRKKYGNK